MDALIWHAPDADHPARRAARASMTAVGAGRREEWLALFAPGALVEDPVGPSFLDPSGEGHRGADGIAAFWDSFIATITTTMGDGSTMTIDCVLIYTVDESGLITSLRAHWEPDRAMATVTRPSA